MHLLSKTGEVPRPEWLAPDRELHVDPVSGEVVRREIVHPPTGGDPASGHAHGQGHGQGHGHDQATPDRGRGGYDDDKHASRRRS